MLTRQAEWIGRVDELTGWSVLKLDGLTRWTVEGGLDGLLEWAKL